LLPDNLISGIEQNKFDDLKIRVIAETIANIAIKSVQAFLQGKLKLLDPNPGDDGCQLRAIALYNLFQDQEVFQEGLKLLETARKINQMAIDLRRTEKRAEHPKLKAELAQLLFQKGIGTVECSKKMEFILLCGFLQTLRKPFQVLPNGIVLTKSDSSQLQQFSKRINGDLDRTYRLAMVERTEVQLTNLSMDVIRNVAFKALSFESKEKEILCRMLSAENTKFTKPKAPYIPKAIGCKYFAGKAMIYSLKEQKALVALKSIVLKGLPISMLFFQSREKGAEFELVPLDCVRKLDLKTPMVVFEAVFGAPLEEIAARVNKCGLTRIILTDFSIQPPYEKGSQAEDVADEQARNEILKYKAGMEELLGSKENPFLLFDHIFANTLENELPSIRPEENEKTLKQGESL
jgi:hypothetical protein